MSLRQQVMRGGAFLALRQGLGLVIGVGGVLLLTRAIGPESYGVYAAAFGIVTFAQSVAGLGINVYLVRREGEERREVYDQAAMLLLVVGLAVAVAGVVAGPLLERAVRLPGLSPVAQSMFALLAIVLVGYVPLAQLERHLDFRTVALIELAGQLLYFAVALPLALRGFGTWAPTLGWATQQVLLTVALLVVARYWPRPTWDRALTRDMLAYGASFSASLWVWNLRLLVNPVVVGRFAGAEAVGIVALAIRFAEYLSFVKTATMRLSIAALGRVQGDADRLRRAVSEGMSLQVLAVAPLLVAFAWLSPWVIPAFFGARWTPVVDVFPFIALGYLANAVFSLQSSALYALRRNWDVATFHLAHIVLFAGAAVALVPRLGVTGYGLAEVVALASYVVVHRHFAAHAGAPRYWPAAVWAAAFGAALFYRYAWWLMLAPVIVALVPASRGWRVEGRG